MSAMFLSLVVLIILGVPVSFAIGLASVLGISSVGLPLTVSVQRIFTSLDTYTLLAIPFFILAGNLMDSGGISKRIINFSVKLVGHVKGGLAMVCVLASMLFGCVSGSASAACAAIGPVVIPGMEEKKYETEFAAALVACAGPLGSIIPPSLTMVIYAMASGASVGKLFLAGYIPGILIGIGMMMLCYFFTVRRGYPSEARSSLREIRKSFVGAIWALFTAIIIVAGIMAGVFTATEASVVAVLYAFLVGKFIYRELDWKALPDILYRSAVTSAVVLFCVATSSILGWIMTRMQIPAMIAEWLLNFTNSKVVFLILVNIILLFLGCILDASPAILLSIPILLPIATSFGIDPVHLGIIVVVNLAIGMSTPPVGITLFVTSSITGTPVSKLIRHLVPFWIVQLVMLILITYVPSVSMWLPNWLM